VFQSLIWGWNWGGEIATPTLYFSDEEPCRSYLQCYYITDHGRLALLYQIIIIVSTRVIAAADEEAANAVIISSVVNHTNNFKNKFLCACFITCYAGVSDAQA